MKEPMLIADEYWWVPSSNRLALAAQAIEGQGYRAALEDKILEACRREKPEQVQKLVEVLLPGLDLPDGAGPLDQAELIMGHGLMQMAAANAEAGTPASPEDALEALENQAEIGLWEILAATPASMDSGDRGPSGDPSSDSTVNGLTDEDIDAIFEREFGENPDRKPTALDEKVNDALADLEELFKDLKFSTKQEKPVR